MNQQFKKRLEIGHVFRTSLSRLARHLEVEFLFQREINQHGMESGLSLEAYFREQLAKYIPDNYAVDVGTIVDMKGYSAGECDVVIYDSKYTPLFWLPVSENDRRKFIAFETTYAVIEVKENLTRDSLKKACEKIIAYKQLTRQTQDRGLYPALDGRKGLDLINPPFGIVFSYSAEGYNQLKETKDWKKLVDDFIDVNQQVPIEQRVNGLFILGTGYLRWVGKPSREARFSTREQEVWHYFPESSEGQCHIVFYDKPDDCIIDMYHFLWGGLRQIRLIPLNLSDYINYDIKYRMDEELFEDDDDIQKG